MTHFSPVLPLPKSPSRPPSFRCSKTFLSTNTISLISVVCVCVCVFDQSLSSVQFLVAPWTIAPRLLCLWNFPVKNSEVGCHFLLQGSSWPRYQIHVFWVFCIDRHILYHWYHLGSSFSRTDANLKCHIMLKSEVKWKVLSCVWLFATPWTMQSM